MPLTKLQALATSFNWYRAFPQDEKDNADESDIDVPVLYLKGEKDFGYIEKYLDGFRKCGLKNIKGEHISNSGHYRQRKLLPRSNDLSKVADNHQRKITFILLAKMLLHE